LGCQTQKKDFVTIALSDNFSSLDSLTTKSSDAAAERIRNLLFNTLVKKNEKFEYVGELAKEIKVSEGDKVLTFVLNDNVKFHNGKILTSADVKYTFDALMKSDGYKKGAFYETNDEGTQVPVITSIETPNPQTIIFTLVRSGLKNQFLSNLVPIPIIPEGTVDAQKDSPLGSGPYKFVKFDSSQNTVDFEGFAEYWEGAPKINKIRVKTVKDANSLQAELQSGGVDVAPLPTNLTPDTISALEKNSNLKVEKSNGSNIQYLQFNTEEAPLDKVKLRQAVAYAIDREKIIKQLLSGQATIAHSILPADSWAYYAGTKYEFNPKKAIQLLKESGYKNEPIKFMFSSGSAATSQYVQVMQNQLKEIGLNIEVAPLDGNVLRENLAKGQYQMNTGVWIGGNQDPIFLKDLFATGAIPGEKVKCCNRSRYSNKEVDELISKALNATDREVAKENYFKVQEIVSNEVPMIPLWYPANMVVANKRIENIKIGASGGWEFVRNMTVVE
jgi:peptide/nickel transport system substrate-binding protein